MAGDTGTAGERRGTAGTQHFDRKVPGPKEGPAAVLLDTGTAVTQHFERQGT